MIIFSKIINQLLLKILCALLKRSWFNLVAIFKNHGSFD
jgi:hypothetical protein